MWQWRLGHIVKTAVDEGLNDPDIDEFGEFWTRTLDAGRLVAIGQDGEQMWYTAYVGPMPNPYDLGIEPE